MFQTGNVRPARKRWVRRAGAPRRRPEDGALSMLSKSWLMAVVGVMLMANSARAGTFGQVVVIGGEAADIALDEARGVLYVANFTANRIDVMSLDNHQIQTSINVPA